MGPILLFHKARVEMEFQDRIGLTDEIQHVFKMFAFHFCVLRIVSLSYYFFFLISLVDHVLGGLIEQLPYVVGKRYLLFGCRNVLRVGEELGLVASRVQSKLYIKKRAQNKDHSFYSSVF